MTLRHQPPPPTRNSMAAISQLLLTWFWPNFKGRFLGQSQWYLSRYHLSWCHLSISGISQLSLTQFWPDNFLGPLILLDPKIFKSQNVFGPYFLGPKHFARTEISWTPNCRTKNFLDQNSLGSNFFESTVCITKQLFWDKKSLGIRFFYQTF